jgi:tetratricopeptide (TPR) repeat protein
MEADHAAPDRQGFRYNEVTVIRALGFAVVLAWAMPAYAEDPAPTSAPSPALAAHLDKVRQLYAARDFVHAREELLAAYQVQPVPDLLFALGQVEFNLHHYREAIDYYERFTATNPTPEQVALAQQAIGAARIELARPKPPPPPPPLHREWDGIDTTLVASAGLLGVGGGALLFYAHHLAQDRAGTLHEYDSRVHHARIAQWSAVGCFAAGAAAAAAAVLRYRYHLVDTVEIQPVDGGHGLALVWERPL